MLGRLVFAMVTTLVRNETNDLIQDQFTHTNQNGVQKVKSAKSDNIKDNTCEFNNQDLNNNRT